MFAGTSRKASHSSGTVCIWLDGVVWCNVLELLQSFHYHEKILELPQGPGVETENEANTVWRQGRNPVLSDMSCTAASSLFKPASLWTSELHELWANLPSLFKSLNHLNNFPSLAIEDILTDKSRLCGQCFSRPGGTPVLVISVLAERMIYLHKKSS